MACLRPSASGRRLSELLEEQQEPFFLDLHLLEKGCSGRLLDAAAAGYDTALCWPAAAAGANDAASVLRRLTSKKKKAAAAASKKQQQQQPTGLLRLLLSKILHGKAASASRKKPAALQNSESFKKAVAASPKHLEAVKLRASAEGKQSCSDSESDEENETQLSPVSVLEHPFESSSSPVHHVKYCSGNNAQGSSPKDAMAVVRELLLEAAYTPALLAQLLAKSEDLMKDAADLEDYYCCHSAASPKNFHEDDGRENGNGAAYWETHRAELARVSGLVCSEVPRPRLDAADVQPERRDVGADVEAAVLEALLLELVVDLGSC